MPTIKRFSAPLATASKLASGDSAVAQLRGVGASAAKSALGAVGGEARKAAGRIQAAEYLRRKNELDLQIKSDTSQMLNEKGSDVKPEEIQAFVQKQYDQLQGELSDAGLPDAARAAQFDGLKESGKAAQGALDFKIGRHMDNLRESASIVADSLGTRVRSGDMPLSEALDNASADIKALTQGLSGDNPIVKETSKIPQALEANDHALTLDADELRDLDTPVKIQDELQQAQDHLEGLKDASKYEFQSPEQRGVMIKQTEARIRSLQQAMKTVGKAKTTAMTSELKDIQASILAAKPVDPAVLKDAKWATYVAQGETQQLEFRKTAIMSGMQEQLLSVANGDFAEQQGALKSINDFLFGKDGPKDFRVRQEIQKEATSLAHLREQALKEDAPTWVSLYSPVVKSKDRQLQDAAGDPVESAAILRERDTAILAEEARLGAPRAQIATKAELDSTLQSFSDPSLSGKDRIMRLRALAAAHPDNYDIVKAQIQRDSRTPAGFGMVAEYLQSDPVAAETISDALVRFPESKKAFLSGGNKVFDLDSSIASKLSDFRAATIEAGVPGGDKTYNDMFQAVRALAIQGSVTGADDAVESAVKVALTDHFSLVKTGPMTIPVPAQYDAEDMKGAMDLAKNAVVDNEVNLAFVDDLGFDDPNKALTEYLDRLEVGGHWVPKEDDSGVVFVDSMNNRVTRDDGTMIEIDYDSLLLEFNRRNTTAPDNTSKGTWERLFGGPQ